MRAKFSKYYLIMCSCVLGMLLLCSNVQAQDTLYFQKGFKTFHATASVKTDSLMWEVIDPAYVAVADTFYRSWDAGIYKLKVTPYANGCSGDAFYRNIKAKDDVTIGGGQVHFSQESVNICPPSDVKPITGYLELPVYFDGDVLKDGEAYLFKYRIDNGPVQSSFPYNKYNGVLTVNIQGLSVGTHYVRITMLYYKEGYSYQVDYSTSPKIPTMRIDIQDVPSIGDINYEK